jgi:hypothetical protein
MTTSSNIEKYVHISSKTLFAADKWNSAKTIIQTKSGARFSVSDCEKWEPNYPQLAFEIPPEVNQVVKHGEHVFEVVRRTNKANPMLWHEYNEDTKSGHFYLASECELITTELIDGWVSTISMFRNIKETSAEYQNFIKSVPAPIRDLCVIRALNYLYDPIKVPEEDDKGFF